MAASTSSASRVRRSSSNRSQAAWRPLGGDATRTSATWCSTADKRSRGPLPDLGSGPLICGFAVELRGFEPLTPSMRTTRMAASEGPTRHHSVGPGRRRVVDAFLVAVLGRCTGLAQQPDVGAPAGGTRARPRNIAQPELSGRPDADARLPRTPSPANYRQRLYRPPAAWGLSW